MFVAKFKSLQHTNAIKVSFLTKMKINNKVVLLVIYTRIG